MGLTLITLERKAVERAVISKLKMEKDTRRDHQQYRFYHDGKLIGKIHFSHTPKMKTLGDDLVRMMAGELKVPTPFFVELVRCTRSRDDYILEASHGESIW